MRIVELKDVFDMDSGAPEPIVIDAGFYTTVSFNKMWDGKEPYQPSCYTIKFLHCVYHSHGTPNDEALHGHLYYALGLKHYSFSVVEDSELIEKLRIINSVHQYYNPLKWAKYKHYIITFKDSTFECVAAGYEVTEYPTTPKEQALSILNEYQ